MNKDLKVFLLIGFFVLGFIGSFVGSFVVSMTYLEGAAKADWIRHTRGIEMPWYRAAFLRIEVTTLDAEVTTKP